jgi:intein-encoded DNA endonuclease-like protein
MNVLPADLRLELYDETLQLRRQKGWGYRRIACALSQSHGIHVPKGTVSNWILGRHNPSRRLHRGFKPSPSPELAYVIGSVLGDGYTAKDQGRSIVGFTNKDMDLLRHFQRNLSCVLGTSSAGRITSGTRYGTMKVTVGSTLLAIFLQRPLRQLAPFIESHPAPFIRGFFDAEGSAVVSVTRARLRVSVTASNSNLEILQYISSLLKKFSIMSSIRMEKRAGTYLIRGEPVAFNKPVFRLGIWRICDVERYAKLIDFASSVKRQRLQEGITLLREYGSRNATEWWLADHKKCGSRWISAPRIGKVLGGPGET